MKFTIDDKRLRFCVTLVTALIGGALFSIIHSPIPWLLGPMTALLIGSRFGKVQFYWPRMIRDTGLVIVGYSIGLSFSKEALLEIVAKLPSMLLMTVLLVCCCAGIAFVVSKLSGVDYPTVLIGSIPGGLSQMIIFAEELKGINITTVTFLQVARLIMIIFFVPFLIIGPLFNNTSNTVPNIVTGGAVSTGPFFPTIIWFGLICVVCALLARKLHFPTPYLLGPIIGTAIFNLIGAHGPSLPPSLLDASQLFIGAYIGLLLKPEKLEHKTKIISLALISGLVMILVSIGLSMLLVSFYHICHSTSFLALAPGGMDQMGILAHVIHADLSMVTGYQIFRLLFIYFVVPPILRWIFKVGMGKTVNTP
ncbi:AbrB family transcriptional regulator [Bacillus sp. AFS073361]|uniref:AbrB family transcriptional regulator n=1 Tax=Bacillus sp. AFS073361 TaxID=2033511 RepID=UPI000BF3E450|nr:AbrB family transcriptional regulator [Bacillus sp. AFS073361]PFP25890.1 AbrB family transcriptional regulator [Bacillus sp. AFS073361]